MIEIEHDPNWKRVKEYEFQMQLDSIWYIWKLEELGNYLGYTKILKYSLEFHEDHQDVMWSVMK